MKNTLVYALATFRATKLVLDDEILREPREALLDRLQAINSPAAEKAVYFLTCPWCVSIWAAGGLALLKKVAPEVYKLIAGVLAASAVTGIVYERV